MVCRPMSKRDRAFRTDGLAGRVGRCPVCHGRGGFRRAVFQRLSDKRRLALTRGGCGRRRGVPQRILARARDHILRRNQRARLRKRPTVFHGEARSRISEPPCCSRCVIFLAFRGRSIAWRSPARQGGNRFSAKASKARSRNSSRSWITKSTSGLLPYHAQSRQARQRRGTALRNHSVRGRWPRSSRPS